MFDMHLASSWPVDIRQLSNLRRLDERIESLSGEFFIVPDIYFHEDKPFVDTLLVAISKSGCGELMLDVDDLGFPSWQEVTPDVFDNELAFNPYHLRPYSLRTWEARLQMAHQHNARVATGVKLRSSNDVFDKPIGWAALAERVARSLERSGIARIGYILSMDLPLTTEQLDEVVEKLRERGYLADDTLDNSE